MSLMIIAAVATNCVIGDSKTNKMPWHVPEELKHFKANTMGKVVVMGRKTAEQVGKLHGRDCIVISNDPEYVLQGFKTMNLEQLLLMNEHDLDKQYVIAGGAEIYKQTIPYANFAMISYMDFEAYGDVMMPTLDRSKWKKADSFNANRFSVTSYTNTNRQRFVK